ncbi:hypothetical protein [Haloarcula marina]|uniref:hypothetical protein n=1 Tax=Haloarcula marina TaxID=2961574 RepID=UPI0020B8D5ED|nr:hypothetical protein [Halomicroarcula marina]
MATITDTCDDCGREQKWNVEGAGGRVDCPECGQTHHVWKPTATADEVGHVPERKKETLEKAREAMNA